MGDAVTGASGSEPMGVADAFGVARELLQGAALDADRTRGEAASYARQREREADLLVQKARRLLVAAEERASVIVAVARTQALSAADDVIDLDELGRVVAPEAARLRGQATPSRLDEMLASAISNAVTDAFPADLPA
jgi:hypothetical protein